MDGKISRNWPDYFIIDTSDIIDCGYNTRDLVDDPQRVPETLSNNLEYPFPDQVTLSRNA